MNFTSRSERSPGPIHRPRVLPQSAVTSGTVVTPHITSRHLGPEVASSTPGSTRPPRFSPVAWPAPVIPRHRRRSDTGCHLLTVLTSAVMGPQPRCVPTQSIRRAPVVLRHRRRRAAAIAANSPRRHPLINNGAPLMGGECGAAARHTRPPENGHAVISVIVYFLSVAVPAIMGAFPSEAAMLSSW